MSTLVLLASTGCETILGEVTVADPAPGAPCAKGERCAPGADCKEVAQPTGEPAEVCLPTCSLGGKSTCPSGFLCAADTKYSDQPAHCYPAANVRQYAVGDRCDDTYSDPCPSGTTCAERPSDFSTGGDVSRYCQIRCASYDDDSCGGASCREGKDGSFFCE